MLITKMRNRECRELLARLGFGRLACVSNNRPYIIPIYFSYDADCLYCLSTLGRKIEWMRENPLVCVEVDEIVAQVRIARKDKATSSAGPCPPHNLLIYFRWAQQKLPSTDGADLIGKSLSDATGFCQKSHLAVAQS